MVDPWTIPIAVGYEAYAHRHELADAQRRISKTLRGEKRSVAITGMPGVGKSVLLDHVSGRALNARYDPPGTSWGVEKFLYRADRLRLRLLAIPGEGPIRLQTLPELFNAKKPVNGLLHVVANGFSYVRSAYALSQLEAQYTLAEFRGLQREAEVNDLAITLEYARHALDRQRRFWVVVVVNKLDLFASEAELAEAQHHYLAREGPFATTLRNFAEQVGRDRVEHETLPVSTWAQAFRWRDQMVSSSLDRGQQLETLRRLLRAIEEHARAGS